MNLGLIGCGRMGSALAEGALNGGVISSDELYLSDPVSEATAALAEKTQGQIATNNLELAQASDIILIACKPYQVTDILTEISPALPGDTVIISIAAGTTLKTMEAACPEDTRIVRAMPNTPAMIGLGATGIAPGTNATDADLDAARKLLESVGIVVNCSESDLDAVTGLSGSGPAYVYRFIRALSDQAVAEGLDKNDALLLATKTVMGAAHMLEQTGRPPQELIDQVSSPGGTTLAGLAAMDDHGFDASVAAAVRAATERSVEIAAES